MHSIVLGNACNKNELFSSSSLSTANMYFEIELEKNIFILKNLIPLLSETANFNSNAIKFLLHCNRKYCYINDEQLKLKLMQMQKYRWYVTYMSTK